MTAKAGQSGRVAHFSCVPVCISWRGLECRHVLAAFVTELVCASEFKGASIHARWRPHSGETRRLEEVERGLF